VLTRFNEADAAGIVRPGLTLATAARVIVTAPWPATVRFAGPFLDYGNVIVLEPEAGYLLVLVGLGDILVRNGQVVKADEAIGLMGGQPPGPEGILSATPGGDLRERPETLYMELRSANIPQDPAAWFALGKE
jgi:septal ring factor EnvC (AmiA/AmiB activator)